MLRSYFEFNNRNSLEFEELIVTKKTIGTPEVKTATVDVPYSSKVIDYSFINGVNFGRRPVEIEISFSDKTKEDMYRLYSEICRWLCRPYYSKLKIYGVEGYFNAKVSGISSLEEIFILGKLIVSFECDPWLYENEEMVIYTVLNKDGVVSIENLYMPTAPVFISSNVCNIKFEGKSYQLRKGENQNFDITFKEGFNEIRLISEGPINLEIKFQRGGL